MPRAIVAALSGSRVRCVQPTRTVHLCRQRQRTWLASTPFDRLCATSAIRQERQAQLETLRNKTNPRQLRRETYDLIDYTFSLPGAVSGDTDDGYLTLTAHTGQGKDECFLSQFMTGPNQKTLERRGQAR